MMRITVAFLDASRKDHVAEYDDNVVPLPQIAETAHWFAGKSHVKSVRAHMLHKGVWHPLTRSNAKLARKDRVSS